jgi:cytochrome bd-type quinol oxidase subunit 1
MRPKQHSDARVSECFSEITYMYENHALRAAAVLMWKFLTARRQRSSRSRGRAAEQQLAYGCAYARMAMMHGAWAARRTAARGPYKSAAMQGSLQRPK